ncbi:MAG: T9SS type A sorting domain-containing protein, partial [Bacteroidales bacterium]|nr:T9SS type A sorting domain-containing protein [Bacteroidales bacterium]
HIATNFIGLYSDTIKGGEYGFSGRSSGWQYVELYWWWVALTTTKSASSVNFDSPVIRFRFKSDVVNTNKEGWMIDDIVLRGYDVGGAIPDASLSHPGIFPNPATDYIHFNINDEYFPGLSFSLYNSQGQITFSKPVTESKMNISFLKPGVYLYKIEKDGTVLKKGRIIKQ